MSTCQGEASGETGPADTRIWDFQAPGREREKSVAEAAGGLALCAGRPAPMRRSQAQPGSGPAGPSWSMRVPGSLGPSSSPTSHRFCRGSRRVYCLWVPEWVSCLPHGGPGSLGYGPALGRTRSRPPSSLPPGLVPQAGGRGAAEDRMRGQLAAAGRTCSQQVCPGRLGLGWVPRGALGGMEAGPIGPVPRWPPSQVGGACSCPVLLHPPPPPFLDATRSITQMHRLSVQ